ncbi:MAG: hypothetical protein HYY87_04130, partial [Candidatus Levybacteria bacterium]|nr:hypothetical protein [Candidatus Levybacteria bacterium]
MSFAELPGKYPASTELIGIIKRKQEGNGDFQMPLVVILASVFAEEGSLGLRGLMTSFNDLRGINPSRLEIDPRRDFLEQIPREFQVPMRKNLALIVFGLSIRSLHEMLLEGSFDGGFWCDMHNLVISGTHFPKLKVRGE